MESGGTRHLGWSQLELAKGEGTKVQAQASTQQKESPRQGVDQHVSTQGCVRHTGLSLQLLPLEFGALGNSRCLKAPRLVCKDTGNRASPGPRQGGLNLTLLKSHQGT